MNPKKIKLILFALLMQPKAKDSSQFEDKLDLTHVSHVKESSDTSQPQAFQELAENQENEEEIISRNILTPANPIIDKHKLPDSEINVKLIDNQRNPTSKRGKYASTILARSKKLGQSFQKPMANMNLFSGYDTENMIYRKYDNRQFNQLNKKKYFSSIFFPIYLRDNNKFEMSVRMPTFEGMRSPGQIGKESLVESLDEELEFHSNFESGNLFAVFKTGAYTYDLVLQNDMNTTGCTQWFYFSVSNRKNSNIMAKFNIINLYKAASLYNQGMKPMVMSSASGKGWKRKGQHIFYEKNCISRQGAPNKFYSSLSFSYDFTKEHDTVEFAHAVPYSYARLMQLMKTIESSKKCVVKYLGPTPLKKTIPIIKFQSEDSRVQKKAIIFMARQHPGEVQGSFAIQQILLNFLKSSTEIDFILWRFNVYIIPMINVDGVVIGNYRCNAMGYDLNRNWEGQEKSKHPQIVFIKMEIKKIMAKQQIQLILDLHGHSNKINSFFYGNPFGPNPFVFPYVASKTCPFIPFEQCTFTLEKKQKAKTARSVLGNLIKQTGNVYTYEISFYGGNKNGKIVNFYQDHFRQLGKDLLTSIYKVYVETYKEEKTLKESLYLKEIRREISKIEGELVNKQISCSDSEAEQQRQQTDQQRKQQMQQKIKEFIQEKSKMNSLSQLQTLRKSQELQKSYDPLMKIQSFSQQKKYSSYQSPVYTERFKRNNSLKPSHLESFIINHDDNLQEKIKKHKLYAQKLKIFGENYLPKPQNYDSLQIYGSDERQMDRNREAMRMNFVIKTRNNKSKHHDYSTLSPIKSEWKQDDLLMSEIVRVNRLEYKKIERQKDKLRGQKSIQRKNSNGGVFKLPSIVNNFKM